MKECKLKLQAVDGHQFDCYQFVEDEETNVGLIVLHEIFGVTEFIKNMCRLWAKKGYQVIAPSLYDRLERNVAIPYTEEGYIQALDYKQRVLGWDSQLSDIEATKQYLSTQGLTRVAILGYSWGGTLAWLSSCRLTDISCAISYYGPHIHQFKDETPKCPCLLHFAEVDDLVPLNHVNEITDIHPSVDVIIQQATHGFRCEDWQGGQGQEFNEKASHHADMLSEKLLFNSFRSRLG